MNVLIKFNDVERVITYVAKACASVLGRHSFTLPHGWVYHYRHIDGRRVHPAVMHMLSKDYHPVDINMLVLECPCISESKNGKLAYTKSERDGNNDRQTVTSIGKYLKRHWPDVEDHIIRDASTMDGSAKYQIIQGAEELVMGIEFGPRSCMQSSYGSIPFAKNEDNLIALTAYRNARMLGNTTQEQLDELYEAVEWDYHPYMVYAAEYGWHMAVSTSDNGMSYDERALLWTNPNNEDNKVYVRTYQRPRDPNQFSQESHSLATWLEQQGYKRNVSWPNGAKLNAQPHPTDRSYDYMLPYLDGDSKTVRSYDGCIVITRDGDILCNNTDGGYEDAEPSATCDRCGDCGDDDDFTWVGRDDDERVCSICLDDEYRYVEGATRFDVGAYYVRNRYAVSDGNDNWYDRNNLPSYIVLLCNGDVAHEDDAVICTDGEVRNREDEDVVCLADECPDTHEYYAHVDNAWQDYNGEWYSQHEPAYERADGELMRKAEFDKDGDDSADDADDVGDDTESSDAKPVSKNSTPAPATADDLIYESGLAPHSALTTTVLRWNGIHINARTLINKVACHSTFAAQYVYDLAVFDAVGTKMDTPYFNAHATDIRSAFIWSSTPQDYWYWSTINALVQGHDVSTCAVTTYDIAHPYKAFES